MPTRNTTAPDITSSAAEPKPPGGAAAQSLVVAEPVALRSGKAARKPRVEAQMRRRAEELRKLLRDLD
jgi:hypothetical protein